MKKYKAQRGCLVFLIGVHLLVVVFDLDDDKSSDEIGSSAAEAHSEHWESEYYREPIFNADDSGESTGTFRNDAESLLGVLDDKGREPGRYGL